MAFPGPFAFVRRPAVMQNDMTEPGPARSVSGERDGLGPTVTAPTSPGSSRYQAPTEPTPAAGASTTSAAGTGACIAHPSISDDNPHGFPPLILAAFNGRLAEVQLLLMDPALDIDQLDRHSGKTALIAASGADKPEMVARLLAAGAKVNLACGQKHHSALMEAASDGHVEVVKTLLTCTGIVLDQPVSDGINALVLAAFNNRAEVVACLLAAGKSVSATDAGGRTALAAAMANRHAAVVEVLLQYGAVFARL
jgi:ankyrin repeat protein